MLYTKTKKFILTTALTTLLALTFSASINVQAADFEENTTVFSDSRFSSINIFSSNIGVSNTSPENFVVPFSVSRPTTVWNININGQYNFAGSSNSQTLYTNYKFTGKNEYTVYVENTGKTPITVKAKRLTKTYATTKISAGKTATFQFSNIKSNTEFYIVFEGDSYSFTGYIK